MTFYLSAVQALGYALEAWAQKTRDRAGGERARQLKAALDDEVGLAIDTSTRRTDDALWDAAAALVPASSHSATDFLAMPAARRVGEGAKLRKVTPPRAA